MDDVEIEAQHCFDNQITIPMPFEAPVDGAILNTATGIVESLAELHYSARVNDVSLSGAFVASGVGQGPFPFVHLLGPTSVQLLPPRASQTHTLRFYLDGPGDAIRLDNSALIRPASANVSTGSIRSVLTVSALLMALGFAVVAFRAKSAARIESFGAGGMAGPQATLRRDPSSERVSEGFEIDRRSGRAWNSRRPICEMIRRLIEPLDGRSGVSIPMQFPVHGLLINGRREGTRSFTRPP